MHIALIERASLGMTPVSRRNASGSSLDGVLVYEAQKPFLSLSPSLLKLRVFGILRDFEMSLVWV